MLTKTKLVYYLALPMMLHRNTERPLSLIVNLRVGPFDQIFDTRQWESGFITAATLEWSNHDHAPLATTEARTVRGPLVHELTGKTQIEVSRCPLGANPLKPDTHFEIAGGEVVPLAPSELPLNGFDLNPRTTSPAEASGELSYFVGEYVRKALDA